MSIERVAELQRAIAAGSLADAPRRWDTLLTVYAKLGGFGSFGCYWVLGDEREIYDTDNAPLLAASKLHKAMYEPDKGTWFSFECTVQRSGEYHFTFNYDEPITFDGREPQEETWIVDLRRYPRPWDLIPDWHPVKQRYTEDEWAQVIEADKAEAAQQS